AYELALAKGASGSLRTLVGMGVGYAWEAEKKYANAAQAYEAAVKGLGRKDFLYEEALMAAARAQDLAGKPAVALEIYQRLLREECAERDERSGHRLRVGRGEPPISGEEPSAESLADQRARLLRGHGSERDGNITHGFGQEAARADRHQRAEGRVATAADEQL